MSYITIILLNIIYNFITLRWVILQSSHFIRDVTFIVTFVISGIADCQYWVGMLTWYSRLVSGLRGPSDLDPDSITYYTRSALCISAGHLNSGLCFAGVCSQPWIIAHWRYGTLFLCHLLFSYNCLMNFWYALLNDHIFFLF